MAARPDRLRQLRFTRWRASTWGYLSVLYAALLLVATGLSEVRSLERIGAEVVFGWDKVLHVGAFSVLAFLLTRFSDLLLVRYRRLSATVLGVGIGASYALAHESTQMWIPGGVFNPLDIMANLIGILLGTSAGVASGSPRGPRAAQE